MFPFPISPPNHSLPPWSSTSQRRCSALTKLVIIPHDFSNMAKHVTYQSEPEGFEDEVFGHINGEGEKGREAQNKENLIQSQRGDNETIDAK